MSAKHTPGPWNGAIGETIYCDTRNPADARLIAAAPDLLAALESLFKECAMVHKHWGEGCNSKQADAAIANARSAIAKATGR